MSLDAKAREAIAAQTFTAGVPFSELDDEDSETRHVTISTTSSSVIVYGSATTISAVSVMQAPSERNLGSHVFFYAHGLEPPTPTVIGSGHWSAATDWMFEDPGQLNPFGASSLPELEILLQMILSIYEHKLKADVYKRLNHLLPILLNPDEYEEGDKLPDPFSFRSMLDLLVAHPEFDVPRINLSRRGYLRLSWRKAENKLTTLECRPDGMIDWLWFAPPARGSRLPQRAAGESAVSEIIKILRVPNALAWMERDH